MNIEELIPFAQTERQVEVLRAIQEMGTHTDAAGALGITRQAVDRIIKAVKARAAKQGHSPDHDMTKQVPDGFLVKGVSTLYGDDGEARMQWVKSAVDRDRQLDLVREAADAMASPLPKVKPTKAPKEVYDNLMAVYPMGDPHFGMYSYARETGADFDVNIAKHDLCAAVDYLVGQAPPCKRAVIANLGDFFHADNVEGVTTRSGNVLDMDTRMSHVVQIGVTALRQAISTALTKHQRVDVINAIGNHDDMLSQMLSIMLAHIYENEPRVTIHDDPTARHYIRHGSVLLGITHGHQTKDAKLPGVMAAERSELWGKTKFRYWFRGHYHQDRVEEYPGCKVEQFRTLAAPDAYAASHGFMSGRDMKCVVMHGDHGEVARYTCNVNMLK